MQGHGRDLEYLLRDRVGGRFGVNRRHYNGDVRISSFLKERIISRMLLSALDGGFGSSLRLSKRNKPSL